MQHLKDADAKAGIVNAPKRQHLISLLRQGETFNAVPMLAVGSESQVKEKPTTPRRRRAGG